MHQFIKGFLLLIFIFSGISGTYCQENGSAPVTDQQIITDLADQWQVYDKKYEAYVPYISERHGIPDALHITLATNKYQRYQLQLVLQQPAYLFIQSKLISPLSAKQAYTFNIDSLSKIHGESLLLSLYSDNGHVHLPAALIVYSPPKTALTEVAATERLPLLIKSQTHFENFLTIAAVLILAFYAFLYNYHPKAFKRYYSLESIFSYPIREDTVLISRPLSGINLLFMFNHSMLLSFMYLLVQWSSEELLMVDPVLRNADGFWDFTSYFFIIALVIFVLFIAKYLFIYVLGNLFKLGQVVHLHYYEYLLYSKVFYSALVLATFFVFVSLPVIMPVFINGLIIAIILFNIGRIVIINFALNRSSSVRNLYLFSYLCATELTPLLIGIKLLLNR